MKKFNYIVLVCFTLTISACKKNSPVPDGIALKEHADLWVTDQKLDSAGNSYYLAHTQFNTLELRVNDKAGNKLITQTCITIDPHEIPPYASNVFISFVAPNRFIGAHDATLSITLFQDETERSSKYVQLLANVNTATKEFFSKKYKVNSPANWAYKASDGAVVQWYQNTLLVREGLDADLNGTGVILEEKQRGTLLVCYERDFSVRYTKKIDAENAYYPVSRKDYIPVSDFEAIYFRQDGLIARERMVTSAAEEATGVKPTVWRIDLKQFSKLPADYSVKLKSYNLKDNTLLTVYDVFDEQGTFKNTVSKEWDARSGFLKHT